MKALAELYVQQFKTTMAMMFQYRASLLIWMIGQVLEPLVYLIVWSVVSNIGGGSVGSYTTQRLRRLFHRADAGQPVHLHLDNVRVRVPHPGGDTLLCAVEAGAPHPFGYRR